MLGQQFGVIGGATERLDPSGGRDVAAGTLAARDLAVGDVADDDVAEGVLGLALDRRAPVAAHEFTPFELVQLLLDLVGTRIAHSGNGAAPEDLAQHRRVLQQLLLRAGQSIQPGGDDALHGRGVAVSCAPR